MTCKPLPEEARLVGNVGVFRPTCKKILDAATVDGYNDLLYQLYVTHSWRSIIIDCECTEFMTLAMLGHYCSLNNLLIQGSGLKLRLCNLRQEIMDDLITRRLDKRFDIHPDLASALASFNS